MVDLKLSKRNSNIKNRWTDNKNEILLYFLILFSLISYVLI